jgi:glutamate-5-semialdehyde dehydrogenase
VRLTGGAVQAIESPDRALVNEMLRMDKYIDMLIPRGGAACTSCAASSRRSR